jgi:hypothetical protein
MDVTKELIEHILEEFFARSKVCQKYGIALRDVYNGTPVPPGWVFDEVMLYWMPPTLSEH